MTSKQLWQVAFSSDCHRKAHSRPRVPPTTWSDGSPPSRGRAYAHSPEPERVRWLLAGGVRPLSGQLHGYTTRGCPGWQPSWVPSWQLALPARHKGAAGTRTHAADTAVPAVPCVNHWPLKPRGSKWPLLFYATKFWDNMLYSNRPLIPELTLTCRYWMSLTIFLLNVLPT